MTTRHLPGVRVSHLALAATIVLLLAVLLVLLSATQARATSGQLLMESRYNGPGNGYDGGRAIAFDNNGYIYVTGDVSTAANNTDIITMKYRPSGTKVWARRWNGLANSQDLGYDIAVDAQRNVYVLGTTYDGSSYNLVTVKYDTAGSKKWAKSFDGPVSGTEYAAEIAVDSYGNAYVGGTSGGGASGVDYIVIKYLPSGVRSWARRYNGAANGNDDLQALTLDRDRNVIVTGASYNAAVDRDFLTVKYSPAGVKRWARRWDRGAAKDEQAEAVAADSNGNVYSVGWGMNAADQDVIIVKYTAGGTFRWYDRYDRLPGDDSARSVAIGPDNSPVLAGGSRNAIGNDDGLLMKFSPLGNQIWKKFYDGGVGGAVGQDWFSDVFVDGSGNVFAAGGSVNFTGNIDYMTARYSAEGVKKWARRYDGPGNGHDFANAVVKVPGGVFVTGSSPGFGSLEDIATLKYQP